MQELLSPHFLASSTALIYLVVIMTEPTPELVIVIPARNEEETIATVIRSAAEIAADEADGCEIVVVDDSSTDATQEKALAASATLLPLSVHLGAWGAMQTGFRYAMRLGAHWCVTMDADGQHLAKDLPDLLRPLKDDRADVVIGSFPERGSRCRKTAWAMFKTISGVRLQDLTSGYRAYNNKALRVLAGENASLYDYQDVGVLIHLLKANMRVAEAPVTMQPRLSGHSRIFHTWFNVAEYMAASTALCVSKRLAKAERQGCTML